MTGKKSRILIFFGVLCIVQLLLYIGIRVYNPEEKNAKASNSVLLNPKYQVNSFSVLSGTTGEKITVIQNDDGRWTGVYEYVSGAPGTGASYAFPVQQRKYESFLDIARKTQTMYTISDTSAVWDSYSLSGENAIHVVFSHASAHETADYRIMPDTIHSELYFGSINNTKSGIAVRSAKRSTAFLYPAEIVPYLTAQPDFWADPFVIPEFFQLTVQPEQIEHIDVSVKAAGSENTVRRQIPERSRLETARRFFSLSSIRLLPFSALPPAVIQNQTVYRFVHGTGSFSVTLYQTALDRFFIATDIFPFSKSYIREISNYTYEHIINAEAE